MTQSPGYFTPAVEGRHAPRYMLIMLIAFALAVVATRGFLELTGYPQLGDDTFHIAHALWGGLLLVAAASLPLIYLNEWISALSAALTGIGVGLFIDEVGKFITRSNDYFFPLAAPIIYVVYVLAVLAYLYVRRQDSLDVRGEMYLTLDEMKALADRRLTADDQARLVERLQRLAGQSEREDLAAVAGALVPSIQALALPAKPPQTTPFGRWLAWLKRVEAEHFSRNLMRRILALVLLALGPVSLVKIAVLLALIASSGSLKIPLLAPFLETSPMITGVASLNGYIALLVVESASSILYLLGAVSLLRRREKTGVEVGALGLILSLTLGHTLAFYFNQFSVVLDSAGLFVVLTMLLRYRDRFLRGDSSGAA